MTQTTTENVNKLKEVSRVESFTLPDGRYYVGCPRYILPDKQELIAEVYEYGPGLHERDGHKFVIISTGGDGYWKLYDTNEDGTCEDPDTGEEVEGPVHVDSLATDVAMLSIMPLELLESLGCDEQHVYDTGHIFDVYTGAANEEDNTFDVEFKYKMYEFEGKTFESLSYVEFLWYKLNIMCQIFEADY